MSNDAIGDLTIVPSDSNAPEVAEAQGQEMSTGFSFADAMLQEVKMAANIPALNTAIYLLRHAIHLLSSNGVESSNERQRLTDCLNIFASAFLTRFSYTGEFTDVLNALRLRRSANYKGMKAGSLDPELALTGFDIDGSETGDDVTDIIGCATTILSDFHASVDLSALETIISIHRETLERRPLSDPDLWRSLLAVSDALLLRATLCGCSEDLDEVVSLRWQAMQVQPNRVICVCAAMLTAPKPHLLIPQEQLEHTIRLFKASAHINESAMDSCISGNEFVQIFGLSGDGSDLNRGISHLEKAEHQLSWGHEKRLAVANNLAASLYKRFELNKNIADLDRAIELYGEVTALQRALANNPLAVQTTNSNPPLNTFTEQSGMQLRGQVDLGTSLAHLAAALEVRFEERRNMVDLDRGIASYSEALDLYERDDTSSPNPDAPSRSYLLHHLGQLLHKQFMQREDISVLDTVIELYREVLSLQPASDPEQSTLFSNLGDALDQRFTISGTTSELREAVEAHAKALKLLSPTNTKRDVFLSRLASCKYKQWTHLSQVADLDGSVELYREALALRPAPHPGREELLASLGKALRQRIDKRGDASDLDEDINVHSQLLSLRPPPHLSRKYALRSLATGLHKRCRVYGGSAQDLDKAIELQREGVSLMPEPDPDRGVYLDTLATLHSTRFTQRGDSADFDTAISLYLEAIASLSVTHFARDRPLGNLGAALAKRYDKTGNTHDLDRAIDFLRQALALRPAPHPDRADTLHNLSSLLGLRGRKNSDTDNISSAIALHREALELIEPTHPNRGGALSSFGAILATRFENSGDPADLENSLDMMRQSLDLVPEPSPNRGGLLTNYALNLIWNSKQAGALDEAVKLFQMASTYIYSSVFDRLDAATAWSREADRVGHKSALVAYRFAVGLLPQLAMLGLDIHARRSALGSRPARGLASNAANCAIRVGNMNLAVELLEGGRSVFWSQALRIRVPLDNLGRSHPKLAAEAKDILARLEEGSHSNLSRRSVLTPYSEEYRLLDEAAKSYGEVNVRWLETLGRIRQQKDFEHFLRPKPFENLRYAAFPGPVIILNASRSQCAALIITFDKDVQCLPLPKIPSVTALIMSEILRKQGLLGGPFIHPQVFDHLFRGEIDGDRSESELRLKCMLEDTPNLTSDDFLRFILTELWTSIAEPVLSALDLTKSRNPPRIWWCPTGPFSFLPIHAAGIYEEHNGDCLSDYVISSYAPTLGTLLDPPKPPDHAPHTFKMTAVIQPQTAGHSYLKYAKDELSKIRERVPQQWLTSLGYTTPVETPVEATVETALLHLQQSSIMHFACHGTQDAANPLDSGLVLTDGRLKISQIMKKSKESSSDAPQRQRMSLAFLSACETAKGDNELPDEAMHLAAALLFAGFRGVVGTMWSIADVDGPKIADAFYEHLFRGTDATSNPPSPPDLTKAAEALHVAVAGLRKEPNIALGRWVPFVHYGL
ncbi:CHAT domain-containing protein [Mycena metata]|uniref:CHAT domain-containing protein n=1 Tax=Mycena metata TaxID=1033252 RepID=A0AAD7K5R5_9AGAR|nr:CHAT domain-containing protein [Mycena metata]